jgi:anti-sigma factor RsiW
MNFEPDDPRLTAYALGELDGAELREMEAHLLEDPAARRVVEEIRASAAMLKDGFGQETAVGLTDKQRVAIGASNKVVHMHAKTEVSKAASRGWKPRWWRWVC